MADEGRGRMGCRAHLLQGISVHGVLMALVMALGRGDALRLRESLAFDVQLFLIVPERMQLACCARAVGRITLACRGRD